MIALTAGFALSTTAVAQPRKHKGGESGGDKTIDKQMEWEKKVMGDDKAKQSDMRKIAAAQKLADEAAKNPPPLPAPKVKDPNKEGVRAKQEAAIGLPIASDNEARTKKTSGASAKKAAEASSSANDELGALVASSLAEEKSTANGTTSQPRANRTKGGGNSGARGKGRSRGRATAGGAPSTLDSMFAASK
ncbi:MAG: hypothetical protein ABUS79_11595 [Pseudomonadota bacterium]